MKVRGIIRQEAWAFIFLWALAEAVCAAVGVAVGGAQSRLHGKERRSNHEPGWRDFLDGPSASERPTSPAYAVTSYSTSTTFRPSW